MVFWILRADPAGAERGDEAYVPLEEGRSPGASREESCVERALRGEGRGACHPLLVLPFAVLLLAGVWAADVTAVRAAALGASAALCPAGPSWCAGLTWALTGAAGYVAGLILTAMVLELFLMASFFVIFAALPLLVVYSLGV